MRNMTEGVAVWQEAVTIPTYPVANKQDDSAGVDISR